MTSEASLRPMLAVTTTDVPKPAEMPAVKAASGAQGRAGSLENTAVMPKGCVCAGFALPFGKP